MVTISYLDDDLMLFMVKSSSYRSLELEFLKSARFTFLFSAFAIFDKTIGVRSTNGERRASQLH